MVLQLPAVQPEEDPAARAQCDRAEQLAIRATCPPRGQLDLHEHRSRRPKVAAKLGQHVRQQAPREEGAHTERVHEGRDCATPCGVVRVGLPLGQSFCDRLSLLQGAHRPRLARLALADARLVVHRADALEKEAGLEELDRRREEQLDHRMRQTRTALLSDTVAGEERGRVGQHGLARVSDDLDRPASRLRSPHVPAPLGQKHESPGRLCTGSSQRLGVRRRSRDKVERSVRGIGRRVPLWHLLGQHDDAGVLGRLRRAQVSHERDETSDVSTEDEVARVWRFVLPARLGPARGRAAGNVHAGLGSDAGQGRFGQETDIRLLGKRFLVFPVGLIQRRAFLGRHRV